jgi:hypothetical protein
VDEWVIGGRFSGPLLVGYRRAGRTWQPFIIEDDEAVRIEAGGASFDIDGDGRLDLVAGDDAGGNSLYWWRNPGPDHDPRQPWPRYTIKTGGGRQLHDQMFGDFDGDGRAELVFWNQGERKLYHAPIPDDPTVAPWPVRAIYDDAGEHFPREGLARADLDGDGVDEILGGGLWFKRQADGSFVPHVIDETVFDPRIVAADFDGDGRPEVVMCPADHTGPLKLHDCTGDPTDPDAWTSRDLLGVNVDHGHSLQVADFNGDGHLDLFCGEMRLGDKAGDQSLPSTMWVLYGDGRGGFEVTELATGFGVHEGKVGDFDGDGQPDILAKPYLWRSNRLDLWLNRHGQGPSR